MGGIDWVDLAQDRNRWRAGVNSVRNLLSSCFNSAGFAAILNVSSQRIISFALLHDSCHFLICLFQ